MRLRLVGWAVTGLLAAFAVVTYINTRDPGILMFAAMAAFWVWAALLVAKVLRDGVPVRITGGGIPMRIVGEPPPPKAP